MHEVSRAGVPGAWQARCSCKARSQVLTEDWEIQDWTERHQRLVQLSAARWSRSLPSLKSQAEYFESKVEDPDTTSKDRVLWKQMADELRARLGGNSTAEQPPLF